VRVQVDIDCLQDNLENITFADVDLDGDYLFLTLSQLVGGERSCAVFSSRATFFFLYPLLARLFLHLAAVRSLFFILSCIQLPDTDLAHFSPPNFLMLFRLCQLTIEYLLGVQNYLLNVVKHKDGEVRSHCPTHIQTHCLNASYALSSPILKERKKRGWGRGRDLCMCVCVCVCVCASAQAVKSDTISSELTILLH
jgi:hypothetical protein